jgi:hypothetical protein
VFPASWENAEIDTRNTPHTPLPLVVSTGQLTTYSYTPLQALHCIALFDNAAGLARPLEKNPSWNQATL